MIPQDEAFAGVIAAALDGCTCEENQPPGNNEGDLRQAIDRTTSNRVHTDVSRVRPVVPRRTSTRYESARIRHGEE